MTCATCRFFQPRPTAAVAADGECTWARQGAPFWLPAVLPAAPAWVDLGDGAGCAAYQPLPAAAPKLSRAQTYTRTSGEAATDE